MATIGIIIGSTRAERNGGQIGRWVAETAGGREHDYRVVDLREFDVPILTAATPPMAAGREYEDPRVTEWSQAIDALDGFIFVTPEYNGSVPGPFKNAFDSLGPEWKEKAIAFVGYGFSGGIHVIDEWRRIIRNFSMTAVRNDVVISLPEEFDEGKFHPAPASAQRLELLLDDLEAALVGQ
ncbi:NADPH-dependent FMN reductase [Corynebacterium phocae]|uniref:NADPH-dependent FMN reductase n=1 Tax=Corynebacterium phocae TaxID=161895 RepID=A0A1L7D199_9CORY|nr:NAD(P)H-dependent oxidoreductase [Corynebacterium phocae]APT91812.1 NADPH-dependent FMN reductase [Corynebacterium phocae]KAA8727960.1 NAD(P)H-dependent oxidoreductase [Corynebacterium phocae]